MTNVQYIRQKGVRSDLLEGEAVETKGRGPLFRRKDGKYLIYLPVYLAEDSMFPFKDLDSVEVKVSFQPNGEKKLLIEEWEEPEEQ